MSAIESVRDRYRTFDDQRYAPLVKGVALFGLLAALPTLIEIDVAGMEIAALLSLKVLILTVIYAYTAQAWNIMSGYTGQFSFGHAAFFGVGAYATQALVVDFAVNPWVGMLVGGVLAAGYGLVIGALSFRFNLQGHYFALATLAFAELLRFVVTNMSELRGANGYFKPFPRDYGAEYGLVAFQFQNDLPYYYLIVGFLLVVTLVSWLIKNSWVGLYFFAIREDERAAASVGVPSFRYKLIGVAVSAFFTALGGAYWSMYFNTIRPDTVFALFKNVELLLPAVVGGPGTLLGPIVGSFIVTPVSEIARTTFSDINGLDRIIYGAFLVAIVIYSPRGVVSWPSQARALWNRVRGDEEVSE
ncbi:MULTISPECIES: branched-chain amino acid ABC transporter permease [unclassified Haloferax]|uniref:branched-chain amino acid ABC transporter permease n=1 Tax=unclassified Haloferax TaxID=2625095 RepID=UPI0002AF609E|nr:MULTISPECIES: branched-chain amino acid ABC transporter permease [unclassified Haloferax]ELZ59646.1 branched-chain amino acid ABC transporter permease [Haloferax sp. ATCC BAA-646]ELZ60535.1 branched-chain amino acid ABC transporter permease [Haloferax sp. ATCC BAA-645]ELZ72154.1 branched-chain amino acid ABC transporter permease [Haloferax sp. ATCC BAA-644]